MLGGNKNAISFYANCHSGVLTQNSLFAACFWRERRWFEWKLFPPATSVASEIYCKYLDYAPAMESCSKIAFFSPHSLPGGDGRAGKENVGGAVTSFLIKFSQNFICVLGALNRFPLICGRREVRIKSRGWSGRVTFSPGIRLMLKTASLSLRKTSINIFQDEDFDVSFHQQFCGSCLMSYVVLSLFSLLRDGKAFPEKSAQAVGRNPSPNRYSIIKVHREMKKIFFRRNSFRFTDVIKTTKDAGVAVG